MPLRTPNRPAAARNLVQRLRKQRPRGPRSAGQSGLGSGGPGPALSAIRTALRACCCRAAGATRRSRERIHPTHASHPRVSPPASARSSLAQALAARELAGAPRRAAVPGDVRAGVRRLRIAFVVGGEAAGGRLAAARPRRHASLRRPQVHCSRVRRTAVTKLIRGPCALARGEPADGRRVLCADAAADRQGTGPGWSRQIEHNADIAAFAHAAGPHHARGKGLGVGDIRQNTLL